MNALVALQMEAAERLCGLRIADEAIAALRAALGETPSALASTTSPAADAAPSGMAGTPAAGDLSPDPRDALLRSLIEAGRIYSAAEAELCAHLGWSKSNLRAHLEGKP